ncbi:MAG: esterase [Desulfuromonadales bacterium GWD2_61_12]|nr:MAG: esterase [Desulfuromonadales bacterium GWD2_61_12]HAD03989.1 esterase [Desulfuromonas sp.]HBT83483.1 esterase [Desulfuromonas sp.]
MTIWPRDYTLAEINRMGIGNLSEHLGMEITAIGDDYLEARMPVDARTHQPAGILHGGASAALAETVGSFAANLVLPGRDRYAVGLEINANHLRGIAGGWVIAVARPLHLGKTTQVWDIQIRDEDERLICVSRLTLAVLEKKAGRGEVLGTIA